MMERAEAFRPGRLWSLWDMLQLEMGAMLAAFNYVSGFNQTLTHANGIGNNAAINRQDYDNLLLAIKQLSSISRHFDLQISSIAWKEVEEALAQREQNGLINQLVFTKFDYFPLSSRIDYAIRVFRDSLGIKNVYVTSSSANRFFSGDGRLFGDRVAEAFPAAAYDIEEAGKCLGLGRATASVFHLMRVVEIGMRALCSSLSVDFPEKGSWNKVLNERLEPAIQAMPEGARKKDLQQSRAHLHAIRLAWRNDTMHPKATYTDEEAGEVLRHVETFMKHLAGRLTD